MQWRQDGSVDLMTDPAFIAKNRLPSVGAQRIRLRPIREADGSDLAALQCPVRSLEIYLRRTQEERGDRTRLFLPLRQSRRDISSQTISSWLRTAIREAYEDLSPGGSKRLKIRAHEVRAVSTSVALARNCALKDFIDAVAWRSNSVFARFYLRVMSGQETDLNRLGAVSVSSTAGAPGHSLDFLAY